MRWCWPPGGYDGLFRDRLTTDDVAGAGQWLALEAGAELVNLEFMQMMPGYLNPCRKTIFNEKTFRYTRLTGPDGRDILENEPDRQALLECRSTPRAVHQPGLFPGGWIWPW